MLSKSTIKDIRALRLKKYRQKYHKIVVEGVKSVRELLKGNLLPVEAIYTTEAWLEQNTVLLKPFQDLVTVVDEKALASISSLTTPQEVIAVCQMPEAYADPVKARSEICLYLDGIRNPGNAGTIFRIADWFGIRHVFISQDTVDPYNPKVIQASMASLFRLHWAEISLEEILSQDDLIVYATVPDGESIYDAALSGQGLIILGNESTGVRIPPGKDVKRIAVPGHYSLGAESLNVAIAAGIVCSEFRRR